MYLFSVCLHVISCKKLGLLDVSDTVPVRARHVVCASPVSSVSLDFFDLSHGSGHWSREGDVRRVTE